MSNPVYKFVIFLIFMLVFSATAQEMNETEQVEQDTSIEEVNENKFDQLVSAESVVQQLRKKYGIRGSVMLSKSMWQVLTSFSNQQQALSIWQTAVDEVDAITNSTYPPHINHAFITGQVLSQYTNGMTLEKWNKSRTKVKLTRKNIEDSFAMNDDLTIYMQLNDIWKVILSDIVKQENIMWSDVFIDSIDLFSDEVVDIQQEDEKTNDTSLILAINEWQQSNNLDLNLAELIKQTEKIPTSYTPLFESIVRFSLNKHHDYYLAASLSWIEVAYRLSEVKSELNEEDKQLAEHYIEHIDTWFLSKEQSLLAVNKQLPETIENVTHHLKKHFNSDEDSATFTRSLPIAYELIEPGFRKYMATPFRREIKSDLEVCLNISEESLPLPQQITLNQFIGCVNDFSKAASIDAKTAGLSGQLSKFESIQAFDRALKLPAWQNINPLYANEAAANCIEGSDLLVNSFEWILAAETLLWFADRWPGYLASYPQAKDFNKIITEGEKLIGGFDCVEESEIQLLKTKFSQIVLAWQNVKTQIKQVANEFNEINLSKGSDINLLVGSDEPSNYRVEDAIISACDDQKSCGIHVGLESSRALFGLYPNHLLMADQLKLGKLKLCYDNVGWENRRSASTHLDNDSVANYFGNFSFSIKGFYEEELIFERKLTSKSEYHYLFSANNEEVLSTYCPLEMVGSKISTSLKEGTYGLVPNRLTFLTASRANESQILSSNWSEGEEWKDQVISDQVKVVFENEYTELSAKSQQAYQQKAKELQDLIYSTILNRNAKPTDTQKSLTDAFTNMNRMTRVFSHLLYVLNADDLFTHDDLHGLLYGVDKIPNVNQMNEFYKNQLNINQLIERVDENMKKNQNKWNNFSSYWSHAYLKNILYRLKSRI